MKAEKTELAPNPAGDDKEAKKSGRPIILALFAVAAVVAIVTAIFIFNQPSGSLVTLSSTSEGNALSSELPVATEQEQPQKALEVKEITPTTYALRQKYFKEAFMPKREEYRLFEKAAAYLGWPIEKVPEYFSLHSEREIFEELPPIPKDFSEIAFMLAGGKTYAIGWLSEEYYLQPEFYPGFKTSGLKYWTEPDPHYWTTNGYGAYPADQYDVLSKSGRDEFVAAVFFYTGYGVQTYQGTTITPTVESLKYFDITIEPNTFLLNPTFPKFSGDWARKLVIRGKLKKDTPPGEYEIGFLIVPPPKERQEEWTFKYRNIYFDAANAIAPSRFPFQFFITVKE